MILPLLLLSQLGRTCATSWWSALAVGFTSAVGNETDSEEFATPVEPIVAEPFCRSLPGLSAGQRRICDLFFDHMPPTALGAKVAIGECQYQFKTARWNCSSPYDIEKEDVNRRATREIGPTLNRGTREAAFTYAIVAAGVAHQVARACRRGQMSSCGCSTRSPPRGMPLYHWGGCGDNVEYGYKFAKEFIDVREKEQPYDKLQPEYGQSLMNRWNNEAGRSVLVSMVKPRCKCHGLSGSCEVKTCWTEMAPLRTVGAALQHKYKQAQRVKVNVKGNLQLVAINRAHNQPMKKIESDFDDHDLDAEALAMERMRRYEKTRQRRQQVPDRRRRNQHRSRSVLRQDELIFIDESPDYCKYDPQMGVLGTSGRICTLDSSSLDNCNLLCCDQGYNTFTEIKSEKCNCHFQWCCEVVCDICNTTTVTHTCK